MGDERFQIDERVVHELVSSQFPTLAHLAVERVRPGGWDHVIFRLGEELAIKFPSAECYAPQIEREAIALEQLKGRLPCAIPERVKTGRPGMGLRHSWAINMWLDGTSATLVPHAEHQALAWQCGHFLACLHSHPAESKLPPGAENFHRGGHLRVYAREVEASLARLNNAALAGRASDLWQAAIASEWRGETVWVHGDFFPWNVLVDTDWNLSGVIDWGLASSGDPACDLAIAWTCFDGESRRVFRDASGADEGTWHRGRGWSLWKAITLATGVNEGPSQDKAQSLTVLDRICDDCDD